MKLIEKTIKLPKLDREASLFLLIPSDYTKHESYPLLIMNDGQNMFLDEKASFGTSWGLMEHFDSLPSMIIAGVSCANGLDRLDEYNPFVSKPFELDGIKRITGGKGDIYIHDLIETVIPFISSKYAIDDSNITIGGSSMGGLISVYASLAYPSIFKNAIGLSNAFWIAEEDFVKYIKRTRKLHKGTIYMDTGDSEDKDDFAYIESNRNVYQALLSKKIDVVYREIPGGIHHESSWRERIKDIIIEVIK